MDRRRKLGKINYAGYAKTAGTTHDGQPLPKWEDLSEITRESWMAGADSVLRAALTGESDGQEL
jgi:hypothetical protein